MTNAEKFLEVAKEHYPECDIRVSYGGRNFYNGPAIDCDIPMDVAAIMPMTCTIDNMGKGYVIYPNNPKSEFIARPSFEDEDCEDVSEMCTEELVDLWRDKNKANRNEMVGTKHLSTFCKQVLGYSDFEHFMEDNPFMHEAIWNALCEGIDKYKGNNWRTDLENEI